MLRPFEVMKVLFFSMLQEAMKRILKQKPQPYKVYSKSKVLKSHFQC